MKSQKLQLDTIGDDGDDGDGVTVKHDQNAYYTLIMMIVLQMKMLIMKITFIMMIKIK